MKALNFRKTAVYLISAAGIIMGIAVAIAILSIAEGGRSVLKANFRHNGVRVYDIELENKGSGEYLTREDGRLLTDKMHEVKGSIPVLGMNAQLKSYKASGASHVLAVNEKYLQYGNLEMLKGSFINEQEVRHADKIAVIDDITALELFGTTDIIGHKLDIQVGGKNVEFAVSGVIKNFNKNIETLFEDEFPGICYIPDSVPEDVSWSYSTEKVIALVDKELHRDEAAVRLKHLLEREHAAAGAYSITEYEQLPEVAEFTDKYLVFAAIIAIVGLLSGGIGVMNAMLLTVQERKKEFSLYKLYGSVMKELQYDVVYRTLLICNGCGILGMILGLAAGNFIAGFVNINPGVSVVSIFFTVAASSFVGILSSLYPASRIKLVNPSEAIWGE